ncbi:MAG: hypothetical protein A3G32_08775 [Deltaproteobacteria bacterium RIFCSPLOWO2_12_FULL_40_28]|nr:MAG: hypothetical protein A3C45_01475 [Deltaproteobacteria bacterium RIFCSPHIGHO2_02_FULL_40_28]OGQ20997.1 MAG: hypothetical protein A3E27_04140 [Deltaproteobacteria bacterium RIFCSPHIGHO2_12_FULL_40_32]OGQ39398.1 MAG: hypothetical protein A3I69_05500 [Deltaproteobacteria bacterium RIFCSPLOWO2_02_FULL_40_36]OGQ54679.1 MAG: hypothetical protein A3G32_08775 [Deltaproteobacteria bacterium RIFCSPLOWO2_12_FULL_40_28]
MAQYTLITPKQLSKLASQFGLPVPVKTKGIVEGTVNTYYRLDYPKKSFFLKVDEVAKLPRLKKEIKILKILDKKIKEFQTPIPLKTANQKFFVFYHKKPILLFKQIPGISIDQKKLSPAALKQIGKALGLLHKKTKNISLPEHRFSPQELKRVYFQIRKKLIKKHPAIDLMVGQWLKIILQNKNKKIPSGLIHADLFAENILFSRGKLTGMLDFEAAGFGPFLFDIAVGIHALCHNQKNFIKPRVQAFLTGYQSVRVLTKEEKSSFEYYLFESALRFLLTRLRDFELKDGAIKASPFKDYREYLVRFSEIPSLMTWIN